MSEQTSYEHPFFISQLMQCKYFVVVIFVAIFAFSVAGAAQSTGTLRGQVSDPSGAVVPGATVAVLQSGGPTYSAKTNSRGSYEIGNLPPGSYTVTVNAQGFNVFVQSDVHVSAGQVAQFNAALEILVEQQKVNVQEETPQVQVTPQNNASAVVLSGKDLEALPDDPDELQSDLEALAGPSAGPDGGQLYIDGFTAGQLPPKSSIREIRINQNPFSAEYDKLGYGRIEVFTKPGTDKFHGQFSVVGNDSSFNSRNPFLGDAEQSPYDSVIYMGNIGGPINKKASFFFDVQRRNIDEIAVVNAPAISITESLPNPRTRTNLSPRIDYQLTPNNSITARYQYYRDTWQNDGVGGFVLPEAGYNSADTEHTFQLTDTQIFGAKIINETHFQFLRDSSNQNPVDSPLQTLPAGFTTGASINVLGAFTGGRASSGVESDLEDRYELQNYTSIAQGKHFIKFGGRLRIAHEASASGDGFNGAFSFPSIDAYNAAVLALETGGTPSGAQQFTLDASPSGAIPTVSATVADAGLYIQDDWKVRPTLTLSGGLRFETQNAIHDHADWAPRVGFAWGIGGGGKSSPKTVLRGGFGLFYTRFSQSLVLDTNRLNGITQQQYAVSIPAQCNSDCPTINFFPTVPPVSQLPSQTVSSIYQIASNLHAPYVMQTAVSLERQVTKFANATLTYLNSRGVHQLMSFIPNAPDVPSYPYFVGDQPSQYIFQYASAGNFRENQLIANFNVQAGSRLSFHGFYALSYGNSDPIGSSSGGGFSTNFASDQHDIALDYGRASFAIRNRVFFGGTAALPRGFRLSPFLVFNSGSPYNVTVGQDLTGDLQFNVRPALTPNPGPDCISPLSACHYTVPTTPYTPIPVNYLTGPNLFTLNLRLAKTIGFGPETKSAQAAGSPSGHNPAAHAGGGPGGGIGFGGRGPGGGPGGMFGAAPTGRRYSLTFSINARNALNNVNPGTPVGVLTSPDFGRSVSLAGGPFSSAAASRKLELQAMFSF
jgi:hypothetical protein